MKNFVRTLMVMCIIPFFFACGDVKEKAESKPGEELVVSYYPDGQKEAEGLFGKGGMQGKWISWYENGQKEREENYVNGLIEGGRIRWYENGQLKEYERYKDGELHGRKTKWDEEGNVIFDVYYEDNVEVSVFVKN